jgi:hypothetical protein
MKFAIALLVLISSIAHSAGYGGAEGDNALGQIIHIKEYGGNLDPYIFVQKNELDINGANGRGQKYNVADECPIWTKHSLVCKKSGKSPLAGATYKITTSKEWMPCKNSEVEPSDEAGIIYKCIKGCNSRTPKIFYENPYEC